MISAYNFEHVLLTRRTTPFFLSSFLFLPKPTQTPGTPGTCIFHRSASKTALPPSPPTTSSPPSASPSRRTPQSLPGHVSIVPSRAPEGRWDPAPNRTPAPLSVQLLAQRPASRRPVVRPSLRGSRCSTVREQPKRGGRGGLPREHNATASPRAPAEREGPRTRPGGGSRLGLVGRGRRRTTARASKARRGRASPSPSPPPHRRSRSPKQAPRAAPS